MYPQKQLRFFGIHHPRKATGSAKLVALCFMAVRAQPHHLPSAEKKNASDLNKSGAGLLLARIGNAARPKSAITGGHYFIEISFQRLHRDEP